MVFTATGVKCSTITYISCRMKQTGNSVTSIFTSATNSVLHWCKLSLSFCGNLFRGCVKQFELNCESALSGAFTLCKTLFNDVFQCYPYFEVKTRVSFTDAALNIHECGPQQHQLVSQISQSTKRS